MNNKNNPWMLTTIFLTGLIVGFGMGRINAGIPFSTTVSGNAQTNTANGQTIGATDGSANTLGQPQQTVQTNPANDYGQVEKSLDSTGHYSIGNKNAKVKIVEFSDFQCPFCHRYFQTAFPQLLKDYIASGKVYYSFYNWPLEGHPQAPAAANASLCAGEQNKYWEFHDLLFANQSLWSGNENHAQVFKSLAQSVGLDGGKFEQCLSSNKFADVVEKDKNAGDKKGVSGTPTFFINDQKIVGAQDYYIFQQAIENEFKK